MQSQEGRLGPSRDGDEQVIPSREQDRDAHVDETEDAGPVAHVLAQLGLLRGEVHVGLVAPERDGREDDVQRDVDEDEDA